MLRPHLLKVDATSVAQQCNEATLREIFNIWDQNGSKTVDSSELANCLAILCGGSLQDKINAAFLLFDTNNSGTMNFEELTLLLSSVFQLVKRVIKEDDHDHDAEMLSQIDFERLPIDTAEKCFKDLMMPKSAEINYQMFLQWITGENLYDDDELEALNRTAPPTKSSFLKKKFEDASEWCKRFMQEQEFIDRIKEMREKAMISSVTLSSAEEKFGKYADVGLIDKNSFFKEMRQIIKEANPDMNATQQGLLESTLHQLYSFFDVDKNGILDY